MMPAEGVGIFLFGIGEAQTPRPQRRINPPGQLCFLRRKSERFFSDISWRIVSVIPANETLPDDLPATLGGDWIWPRDAYSGRDSAPHTRLRQKDVWRTLPSHSGERFASTPQQYLDF